jgi:hypothetical protein
MCKNFTAQTVEPLDKEPAIQFLGYEPAMGPGQFAETGF